VSVLEVDHPPPESVGNVADVRGFLEDGCRRCDQVIEFQILNRRSPSVD
jgi:hypothetical protein